MDEHEGHRDESGRRPLTVVHADDNSRVRELLRTLLAPRRGWTLVGQATTGVHAVELVGRLQPDVVVLDDSMPLLTGVAALPAVRAACPHARVVLWSAGANLDHDTFNAFDAVVDKGQPLTALLEAMHSG